MKQQLLAKKEAEEKNQKNKEPEILSCDKTTIKKVCALLNWLKDIRDDLSNHKEQPGNILIYKDLVLLSSEKLKEEFKNMLFTHSIDIEIIEIDEIMEIACIFQLAYKVMDINNIMYYGI